MKTVIQRVKSASVTVDGQLISTIGKGLLVLAAIAKEDTPKEVESMAAKVLKVKLWDDDQGGKWKKNVQEIDGEVLCVSQFTLLASMKKGNKPSFHASADPAKGKELYDLFFSQVRKLYSEERVKDGVFQAMMDVGLVNDGPVSDEPPQEMPTTPCIGVDFSSVDEEVTIELETNPPKMDNPSGFQTPDSETFKGHLQKTFEYPAELLE
ncbi:Putative D-aminoacyl-tRNA deacylase DTD, D-aminoacyl-tRNA deacylase-like superfamily [Septoria linicola]|uniref:D-aminoacyl-tRNA deacylase n=1 Tax=Septoria linicola TaxID=215465 RepID=A0A9Q9AUD6_9PEZI|nr:Putative D-aminoacyl-tRNA deacylase DTD, D-aminoacyl-tRNA deacylase-like superfamily [Septoria linicola]